MAVTPTADGSDDTLQRLEAALEAIDRGLQARPAAIDAPMAPPASATVGADLQQVEERLDAAIDFVKSVLGRKTDS